MRTLTFDEIGQVVGGQSAPPSGGGTSGSGGTTGGTSPAPGGDRTVGREPDGGVSVFEGAWNRTRDFLDGLPGRAAEVMDEGLEWIDRNNAGTPGAYGTAKIGEPLQPGV